MDVRMASRKKAEVRLGGRGDGMLVGLRPKPSRHGLANDFENLAMTHT
jgi:hypothetical protein